LDKLVLNHNTVNTPCDSCRNRNRNRLAHVPIGRCEPALVVVIDIMTLICKMFIVAVGSNLRSRCNGFSDGRWHRVCTVWDGNAATILFDTSSI